MDRVSQIRLTIQGKFTLPTYLPGGTRETAAELQIEMTRDGDVVVRFDRFEQRRQVWGEVTTGSYAGTWVVFRDPIEGLDIAKLGAALNRCHTMMHTK